MRALNFAAALLAAGVANAEPVTYALDPAHNVSIKIEALALAPTAGAN